MIVTKEKHEVVKLDVGAERAFSIKTSAKSFRILSDGLYKNKILAIIRELSCNAHDAHVDAKKSDEPFEVHVPNTMEPWFSVKDFGIGLSREDVMNLYTTYFESTKTNSNELIGALGLGSKSPFSYTDNFIVTSRFAGEKMTFSCFINAEGIPCITEMAATSTDESNGLEVQLSVKSADIHNFFNESQKFFATWRDVKPKIIGSRIIETKLKVHEHGKNWSRCSVLDVNGNSVWGVTIDSSAYASQGNVLYPLDTHLLVTQHSHGFTDTADAFFLSNGFIYDFKIGDLEVAPSREQLDYTPTTVKNLRAAIDVIASEYFKKLNSDFQAAANKCTTVREMKIAMISKLSALTTAQRNAASSKLTVDFAGLSWQVSKINNTEIQHHEIDGLAEVFLEAVSLDREYNNDTSKLLITGLGRGSRSTKSAYTVTGFEIPNNFTADFQAVTPWFDAGLNTALSKKSAGDEAVLLRLEPKAKRKTVISVNLTAWMDRTPATKGFQRPTLVINDLPRGQVRNVKLKLLGFLRQRNSPTSRISSQPPIYYVGKRLVTTAAYQKQLDGLLKFMEPCEVIYMSLLPKYKEEDSKDSRPAAVKENLEVFNSTGSHEECWELRARLDEAPFSITKKPGMYVGMEKHAKGRINGALRELSGCYLFSCYGDVFTNVKGDAYENKINEHVINVLGSMLKPGEKLYSLRRGHVPGIERNKKLLSAPQLVERYFNGLSTPDKKALRNIYMLQLNQNSDFIKFASNLVLQHYDLKAMMTDAYKSQKEAVTKSRLLKELLMLQELVTSFSAVSIQAFTYLTFLNPIFQRKRSEQLEQLFGAAELTLMQKERDMLLKDSLVDKHYPMLRYMFASLGTSSNKLRIEDQKAFLKYVADVDKIECN